MDKEFEDEWSKGEGPTQDAVEAARLRAERDNRKKAEDDEFAQAYNDEPAKP